MHVSFAKKPYKTDDILQKETYNFKEPTNRSHPILMYDVYDVCVVCEYLRVKNACVSRTCFVFAFCHSQ